MLTALIALYINIGDFTSHFWIILEQLVEELQMFQIGFIQFIPKRSAF